MPRMPCSVRMGWSGRSQLNFLRVGLRCARVDAAGGPGRQTVCESRVYRAAFGTSEEVRGRSGALEGRRPSLCSGAARDSIRGRRARLIDFEQSTARAESGLEQAPTSSTAAAIAVLTVSPPGRSLPGARSEQARDRGGRHGPLIRGPDGRGAHFVGRRPSLCSGAARTSNSRQVGAAHRLRAKHGAG